MCNGLHVLPNGAVQSGAAKIHKQKDRIGLQKFMILAIEQAIKY